VASPNGVAGALAGASEPDPPVACRPSELLAGAHIASFATGLVGDNASCVDALARAGIAAVSMTAAGAGTPFGGSGAARHAASAATAGS
jgi:pyrimidine deaminase RibD-like protein